MFSRISVRLFATLTLLFVITACGADESKKGGLKKFEDRFEVKVGTRTVQVQIAALDAEMQRGLMFREKLETNEGMIFVFTRPQPMGFWMRNTLIPLDIGYFDAEGVLREIYPMYPHDEKSVLSRARNLQFALEMNQGWFKQNDVQPGAKLDLKAITEALRARGLKAEAAGLR